MKTQSGMLVLLSDSVTGAAFCFSCYVFVFILPLKLIFEINKQTGYHLESKVTY